MADLEARHRAADTAIRVKQMEASDKRRSALDEALSRCWTSPRDARPGPGGVHRLRDHEADRGLEEAMNDHEALTCTVRRIHAEARRWLGHGGLTDSTAVHPGPAYRSARVRRLPQPIPGPVWEMAPATRIVAAMMPARANSESGLFVGSALTSEAWLVDWETPEQRLIALGMASRRELALHGERKSVRTTVGILCADDHGMIAVSKQDEDTGVELWCTDDNPGYRQTAIFRELVNLNGRLLATTSYPWRSYDARDQGPH
jgi:hypothetical protein